jgi:magnesium chelatase family protein
LHACPCGFFGDAVRQCTCSDAAIVRYQARISGPLLDRIDMFVDVPRVEYEKLTGESVAEPSQSVRQRVEGASQRQQQRFSGSRLVSNAEMGPLEVREYCQRYLADGANQLLRMAMTQLSLSARAFHRVLKVARTIADLGGSEGIEASHVAEALQYRNRGRSY